MVINNGDGLKLASKKVTFEKDGVVETKYIGKEGEKWWTDLETKHDNINIQKIEEANYSEDVINRFNEVKDLDIDEGKINEYVQKNQSIKGLENIILKKENEKLKEKVADLAEIVLIGG